MIEENIKQTLDAIRSRLISERITQNELARRLHINPSTLSLKLTGKNQFRLDELNEIASILHCSAADLVASNTADGAYTVDQVARMLGRSHDQVLDLIHAGRLEAIQPVTEYLITRQSYEKYINAA